MLPISPSVSLSKSRIIDRLRKAPVTRVLISRTAPSPEREEIDRQARGREQGGASPGDPGRPAAGAAGSRELPEGVEGEEADRRADQDAVRGQQIHDRHAPTSSRS